MLPEFTLDIESIEKNWDSKESQDYVKKICEAASLGDIEDGIPVYNCDDTWFNMGVYKEAKKLTSITDYFEYGYCDNEESLKKYLQPLIEEENTRYYVCVHLMSMDYEKYYKNGSYINKDGVDTGDDYWYYIDEHPEMEIDQEWENNWLAFSIRKVAE